MITSSHLSLSQALLNHYSRIGAAKAEAVLFNPTNGIGPIDLADALQQPDFDPAAPRSLYINLPFCPVRCLNCDNDTVITHDAGRIDRYLDGLENEITLLTRAVGTRPRLHQLHLGGGSPNYLNDRQLVRLMAMVDDHFNIDDDTETSLEANPTRTSPSQLTLLRGLGFDRISFGVRDLDPGVQLAIGRTMSIEMIRDVFDTARDVGFETIGTDIVYGLPCQTSSGVRRTVDNLLALSPDRISCSAFTRRAATRTHQSGIDHCTMPSLADKMALFNAVVDGLSAEYQWIGLDSFAKPEDELTTAQAENRLFRNCIGYSDLPTADVHGIGTSAISDLEHICAQNHVDIDPWERAIDADALPIRGGTRLSDAYRAQRNAVRSLLCNMELEDYAPLLGNNEDTEATWDRYARDGLVSITPDAIRVTNEGRFVLPHLLAS
jgi:oxygen-independent coproporphyrinogen-3 oxidase